MAIMPQEVAILSNQVLKKLKDETTVKNYVAMRSYKDKACHAKTKYSIFYNYIRY